MKHAWREVEESVTSSDDHVKQALRDLRSLVDAEYPVTTLQSDDARSIVDRAWSAAADGFDRDDVGGQNALRVLRQLRRVDDLLHDARNTAATEVSTRLGEILERLDAAPCTCQPGAAIRDRARLRQSVALGRLGRVLGTKDPSDRR